MMHIHKIYIITSEKYSTARVVDPYIFSPIRIRTPYQKSGPLYVNNPLRMIDGTFYGHSNAAYLCEDGTLHRISALAVLVFRTNARKAKGNKIRATYNERKK